MRTLFKKLLTILFFLAFCRLLLWLCPSNSDGGANGRVKPENLDSCKTCKEVELIDQLLQRYSSAWRKKEASYKKFRSLLSSRCHAISKAVVTQENTPVGSKVRYDGEKRKPLQVTPELFSTFTKEQPFGNASMETCAVVGNGGILINSSCGGTIDSAKFVIRCNLPPLGSGYERDVGNKTDLVTANPSILLEKFSGLMERRRPFVDSLRQYGRSLLLLPAFSYGRNTPLSLRALYAVEDLQVDRDSAPRSVFLNPEYLSSLAQFWQGQGLRTVRLSTGLIVASLALELCANVHLYGFWPFSLHPRDHYLLTNHYYDDQQSKKNVHAMPAEFEHLLRLHSQGIVHLHLGKCLPA
ncbi:alpha-2,8-sialyltransferase 8E isoform X1 [Electrophorus electricus]|uniref:ST8 alpha-N-acetyl-neuraminide alpha-2,8-sialyltransferase 6 n=1 Tax=Electrophorus electricus TaxID=8005 RepID=A0AAY5F0H4_ELEEL|nr:alpha-2,8-sialyltransferase 8E isoform X1 [Electrophorus electricus]